MAFTYETIDPPIVPNTTMQKMINDGTHLSYKIIPNDGYVLHDKNYDTEVFDEITLMPTGEILLGYTPSVCTCGANYDFSVTTTIDGYTAYGIREFFARSVNEVPTSQIFTAGNDHEVM